MKTCFKCGEQKPIEEFYADPRMADGRLGKCKACTCADARMNRAAHLAERRDYERQRNRTASRRAQKMKNNRCDRRRYPEKTKARAAVQRALRSGKLVKRPCEVCGKVAVHAHHEDYAQPLKVRWLCSAHHFAEHGVVVPRPF